ncbi:MAG: hypothetical protein ACLQIB_34025, partial [Isosphaeraceae bacterium]
RMKHQAVVGNIGHFDNEIDVAGLTGYDGIERVNIKPQVDKWVFPDGHAIILLSEGRLLEMRRGVNHGTAKLRGFAIDDIVQCTRDAGCQGGCCGHACFQGVERARTGRSNRGIDGWDCPTSVESVPNGSGHEAIVPDR